MKQAVAPEFLRISILCAAYLTVILWAGSVRAEMQRINACVYSQTKFQITDKTYGSTVKGEPGFNLFRIAVGAKYTFTSSPLPENSKTAKGQAPKFSFPEEMREDCKSKANPSEAPLLGLNLSNSFHFSVLMDGSGIWPAIAPHPLETASGTLQKEPTQHIQAFMLPPDHGLSLFLGMKTENESWKSQNSLRIRGGIADIEILGNVPGPNTPSIINLWDKAEMVWGKPDPNKENIIYNKGLLLCTHDVCNAAVADMPEPDINFPDQEYIDFPLLNIKSISICNTPMRFAEEVIVCYGDLGLADDITLEIVLEPTRYWRPEDIEFQATVSGLQTPFIYDSQTQTYYAEVQFENWQNQDIILSAAFLKEGGIKIPLEIFNGDSSLIVPMLYINSHDDELLRIQFEDMADAYTAGNTQRFMEYVHPQFTSSNTSAIDPDSLQDLLNARRNCTLCREGFNITFNRTEIVRGANEALVYFSWSNEEAPNASITMKEGVFVFKPERDPDANTSAWELIALDGNALFLQLSSSAQTVKLSDVSNSAQTNAFCTDSGVSFSGDYCMISDVCRVASNQGNYQFMKFTVNGWDSGDNRIREDTDVHCTANPALGFFRNGLSGEVTDTVQTDSNGQASFQYDPYTVSKGFTSSSTVTITCSIGGKFSQNTISVQVYPPRPPVSPDQWDGQNMYSDGEGLCNIF